LRLDKGGTHIPWSATNPEFDSKILEGIGFNPIPSTWGMVCGRKSYLYLKKKLDK
jgi:hypothetical protein